MTIESNIFKNKVNELKKIYMENDLFEKKQVKNKHYKLVLSIIVAMADTCLLNRSMPREEMRQDFMKLLIHNCELIIKK